MNMKKLFLQLLFLFLLFDSSFADDIKQSSVPVIIAHHGSGADWPANTVYAIQQSQKYNVKIINLTLELSKDEVPFIFHGFDLSLTTNGYGNPESKTIKELKKLDAGYNFIKNGKYIYRGKGLKIPTLKDALEASDVRLILDIKTHRYKDLINELDNILTSDDWKRVVFYSTDRNATTYLIGKYPDASTFQSRDNTRKFLLQHKIEGADSMNFKESDNWSWLGFENTRNMSVCESFTLGQGCTKILFNNLWDSNIIDKIHANYSKARLVMFAVNSCLEYLYATSIGMYAVYADSILKIKNCRTMDY